MAHKDNLRGALFHFPPVSFEARGEEITTLTNLSAFFLKQKRKTIQNTTSRDMKLPKLRTKMQTAET